MLTIYTKRKNTPRQRTRQSYQVAPSTQTSPLVNPTWSTLSAEVCSLAALCRSVQTNSLLVNIPYMCVVREARARTDPMTSSQLSTDVSASLADGFGAKRYVEYLTLLLLLSAST